MTQNQDFSFSAELAPRFNRLNRAVLTAEKAEEWQPAIAEMTSFLLQVEGFVQRRPDLLAEDLPTSSRVLSLLLTLAATGTQGRLELYQPKDEKTSAYRRQLDEEYLPGSAAMRRHAIRIAKEYLTAPVFASLREDIRVEILP